MKKYNHLKTEKHWQKIWLKERIFEPELENPGGKGKFYNLMMFPYPSAEGLHVGNMYAFTGSDIYGRFKRMQGYDVFEPIGLDGFGMHSENYAIKIGKHPADQAKISQKRFYKQLEAIGNGFAWGEKLETYDPKYYRWTQWIFTQMFKHGLAYRKKALVNWCPSCKTVLADEQVISGKCERCDNNVIRKNLEQWFFKITKYADRLLANLKKIDWSERIKIAQRNWIGKSEGALLEFPISNFQLSIKVFTTRPDTLFGATYLVLSPEHELIKSKFQPEIQNWREVEDYIKMAVRKTSEERIAESKEKTGVELRGIKALNPVTRKEIPVWIADYVLADYGTGAIMAVPAHDVRDFAFAKKFNLPIVKVIKPEPLQTLVRNAQDLAAGAVKTLEVEAECWEGEGILINSDNFSGMESSKAEAKITQSVGGKIITRFRLRDWLISRQRYWGPPIPMINCEKCGWQPVPEKDLPVVLPKVKDFRPTGTEKSPLAMIEKFVRTKCPVCNGPAQRETDVSDTFLDSAWYYLGYLLGDKKLTRPRPSRDEIGKINPPAGRAGNQKFELPQEKIKTWLPVDMYIGGAEHAVLHLLYIRFLAMVFKDWGLIDFEEPISKFRAHGLIIRNGAKMSKSRGNIVNPDEYIKNYGADALRMYLMFTGPFQIGGDFREEGMAGITRFLQRVWQASFDLHKQDNREITNQIHKAVKKIGEDIERLSYNTAISELMVLLRAMEQHGKSKNQFSVFLKLLAPFAPYISEEVWRSILSQDKSIHNQSWPVYDPHITEEEQVEYLIQINGKVRSSIRLVKNGSEKEVITICQQESKIKKYLAGNKIKRTVFVPNRLVNFVI
jgi:leucyl-tRNA synthetase